MIPTLQTERLTLRPMAIDDYPAYLALMTSGRSIGMGGPFDKLATWGLFCHDVAGWALFGIGALMVDRQSDGATLGQVSVNHGPLFPEPELGWMVYDGHEGQGYATEAARTMRDWAFEVAAVSALVSYTDADNHPSIAVARRLGAVVDDAAPRPDPTDLVWRHFRGASPSHASHDFHKEMSHDR